MEPMWYYVRNGAQTGPVSFEELKKAADSGQIAAGDLIWQEGTPDWVPAQTVAGLFPEPPPRPAGPSSGPPPVPPRDRRRDEPLPLDDYGRGPPSPAAEVFALAGEFFRRATAPNPAVIRLTPAEEERLTQAGVTDPTARKIAVWRRAVLWVAVLPTAFAALFGFINAIAAETDGLSSLGILVVWIEALALFALPTFAVLAALAYDRLGSSARLVRLGALLSIGIPILIAFVPAHALVDFGAISSAEREQAKLGAGLLFGIAFYLVLLPTVLSLLPAASRACIRVKSFLPQSLVPGWGLVASVPLFVLLTLATFILLYQFVGNFLLVLGLMLWIGAPMLYLTKFRLLTRPVTDRRDMDSLAKTQMAVLAMITGGVVLLIIYLFTAKVGPMSLMGSDERTSLMRPWSLEIHRKWIEYIGRSLFLTVLFADLMVRMALSVWREEKAFAGTEGKAKFDESMTGLADAIEPRRGEPLPRD